SAEQHDLAVARDLIVHVLDVFRRQADRPAYARALELDPASEVNDDDVFARVQPGLELLRRDARDPQLVDEVLPLRVLPHQVETEQREQEPTEPPTQCERALHDREYLVTEDVSQPDEGASPEQRAKRVVEEEVRQAHA